ncbi:MAG: flagellar biosynthesis protein FlhF [Bacillota bacterium]
MKIRKYLAADMKEGLSKVKKDLGSEAVILHSRRIRRKGLRGFFTPRQMEITAAVDQKKKEPQANSVILKKVVEREKEISDMAGELKELKNIVSELSTVACDNDGDDKIPGIITKKKSSNYWRNYLEHHDVDPILLEEIFSEAEEEAKVPGRMSHTRMAEILKNKAARKINFSKGFNARTQIFIGPTGVGKTTTLAKLAARSSFSLDEKVGLITIDHYRIGAVEQLRTYSEIMDLPLEVVITPQDLFKVMVRLESCDRIFVDTAGRSTGSEDQLDDLLPYIDMLQPADIYLVISATTRRQDIGFITERFKRLKYNSLVITKLDETNAYGALLNGTYYTRVPLVFLTDGQRVPEDLKLASEVDLAGLLWRAG